MRLLAFAVLLLVPTIVSAETLPPAIAARVEQDKKDCGQPVKLQKGFITQKDVNGDGVPDIILDYGHFVCGDFHSLFCGSAGCVTAVFASSGGSYVKVFDDNVQGMTFKTIKGRPAMQLGLHGSACGKAGSAPCGETLYWNGSTFSAAHGGPLSRILEGSCRNGKGPDSWSTG